MSLRILILGINGFIGHRLTESILSKTDWQIDGIDLTKHRIERCLRYPRLHFKQGDVTKEKEWIEEHLKKSDVVMPLVAIANPALYVSAPLKVFHLDFETNLEIIKLCVKHKKRIIFPSTSEVYGMCPDSEFSEDSSNLVTGPVQKERWIYSASKQLLDRVIYAFGRHEGLDFTLFRPFNWIGPRQDDVSESEAEHARVVTRFISNIMHGRDIELVNGGNQSRSFTYIDDGVEALMKIIENDKNSASGRIFNIGNPKNNASIRELAERIKLMAMTYPSVAENANRVRIIAVNEESFYGQGYQDVSNRVPSIKNAEKYLDWHPKTDLNIALKNTCDYYFAEQMLEKS